LLNDLIQEESHLELRQATNSPREWALALKLSTERSALWKKNLGTVLTNLYGATNRIRVEQSEGWVVVSAASTTSGIAKDLLSRVQRATPATTNYWVEAAINLERWPEALGPLKKLGPVPRIALNVIGDHDNVRTRAELQYPGPIPFEQESWNFPTNLIREPLVGFTAVRGIKPWLEKSEHWNRLQLGPPPNQLYIWSLQGIPLQTYFAAPVTDASNRLEKLSERLVQQGNPWLEKYGMGHLERWTNGNALSWIDIPFISPHLQAWPSPTGEFLEGGFFPLRGTNTPPPDELLKQIFAKTNLVSYDWEITAARADAWLHLGQLLRLLFKKAQLPAEAAGIVFLKAASPRLGNCGTILTRESEDKLTWVRQSSVGMTGFELHLLLDWLEAPQFPAGLYTTGATNLMIYPKTK
jgi:hypothetical protein